MNATYVHILVNHLPLFGALFGTVALVWGLLKHNLVGAMVRFTVSFILCGRFDPRQKQIENKRLMSKEFFFATPTQHNLPLKYSIYVFHVLLM